MSSLRNPLEAVRDRLRIELRDAFERSGEAQPPADDAEAAEVQQALGYEHGVVAGLSTALDLIEGEIGRQQRIADEHVPGRVYS